ncbi:MAG: hypothetical protein H0X02_05085 [Nitrosomonas sp.]|nr:hypothetical protein [Nitrosomonas sp.]
MAEYERGLISIAEDADSRIRFYKEDGTEIPRPVDELIYESISSNISSRGAQFLEKLGCLFMEIKDSRGVLIKYDGTQIYRAGVPLPHFSCAQRADAGATYVRVIQHHNDFQGNIVNSGYVEFRATPDGSNNVNIRLDRSATDILAGGLNGVLPTSRPSYETLGGNSSNLGSFDTHYVVLTSSSVSAVDKTLTITTAGNHGVYAGAYLLIKGSIQLTAATLLPEDAYAIALKVKSQTGTTVVFDLDNAKYLDSDLVWQTANIDPAATFLTTPLTTIGAAQCAANYWVSVWTSNVATGNYVYKGLAIVPYGSSASLIAAVNVASPTVPATTSGQTAFNLAGNLGDIYDVTTVKSIFPPNS